MIVVDSTEVDVCAVNIDTNNYRFFFTHLGSSGVCRLVVSTESTGLTFVPTVFVQAASAQIVPTCMQTTQSVDACSVGIELGDRSVHSLRIGPVGA